jgi:protein TonB
MVSFRATPASTVREQPTDFRRPRRVRRWTSGVGAGLAASLVAHAVVGVTLGAVIGRPARSAPPAPAVVDVDVAVARDLAGAVPAEQADAPASKPAAASNAHRARLRKATPSAPPAPRSSTDKPSAQVTPRFVLAAGVVASRGAGSAAAPVSPPSGTGAAGAEVLAEGAVDIPARLVSTSPLVYPAAARQAEIEVDLPVEIVIETDGRVSTARALGRAGYGLDEAAQRAVRLYRFSPALRAGLPVRVRMRWTMQFRLR